MATKDYTIKIVISAANKAKGIFGQISRDIQSLGKGALSIFGKLAKAAAIGGGVMAAGMAAAGAGVLKLASDGAKLVPLEKAFYKIADAAGTSGDVMMKSLQESSKGLITNTELMQQYNLASSLVSKQFANELPQTMKMVGRVAAATGQDFSYLMNSIITGVGRQQKLILDNLGIQLDLTAANEAYAESLGKQVKDLTEAEKQMATYNETMRLLEESYGDVAQIEDPISALMTTWINFKDDLAKKVFPAIAPSLEKILETFQNYLSSPEMVQRLDDFVETLSDISAEIVTFLSIATDPKYGGLKSNWMKEYWKSLLGDEAGTDFHEQVQKIIKVFEEDIPKALSTLQENVNNANLTYTSLKEDWYDFLGFLDDVKTFFEENSELLDVYLGIAESGLESGRKHRTWLDEHPDLWDNLKGSIRGFLITAQEAPSLFERIKKEGEKTDWIDKAKELWDKFKGSVQDVINKFTALRITFQTWAAAVRSAVDTVKGKFDEFMVKWEELREKIKSGLPKLPGWLQDIIGGGGGGGGGSSTVPQSNRNNPPLSQITGSSQYVQYGRFQIEINNNNAINFESTANADQQIWNSLARLGLLNQVA